MTRKINKRNCKKKWHCNTLKNRPQPINFFITGRCHRSLKPIWNNEDIHYFSISSHRLCEWKLLMVIKKKKNPIWQHQLETTYPNGINLLSYRDIFIFLLLSTFLHAASCSYLYLMLLHSTSWFVCFLQCYFMLSAWSKLHLPIFKVSKPWDFWNTFKTKWQKHFTILHKSEFWQNSQGKKMQHWLSCVLFFSTNLRKYT